MKPYIWDGFKEEQLNRVRGVSFKDAVAEIEAGRVLHVQDHPNPLKYWNQRVYIIELNNYAYLVPFVEEEKYYFLKTIIPSRKATRKYLKRDLDEKP